MSRRLFVGGVVVGLLLAVAGGAAAVGPGSDSFAAATPVSSLPASATQSTAGATTEAGEPQSCWGIGHTVWFSYTPTTSPTLTADTNGSNFDTVVAVYTGSWGSLTQVGCDDDSGQGLQSWLELSATAGTTYWFQIGGYYGSSGNLVFNLAGEEPPELTIVKDATPGDDTPFPFVCSLTGVPDDNFIEQYTASDFAPSCGEFTLRDPSDNTEVLALQPQVVTELVPEGWTLGEITCDADPQFWHSEGNALFVEPYCPLDVAGRSVCEPPTAMTCTFRNSGDGRIIVNKGVSPVGAPAGSFGFDASFGDFSLAGGGSHDSGLLPAGIYSVSEVLPLAEGWSLASAYCSDGSDLAAIGVSPGETVTCTFNNRYQAVGGSLTVIKRTTPAGGAGFAFDAGALGSFGLDDGGMKMFEDLAAGAYTVTETPADGWEFEDVTCFGAAGTLVDFVADGASVTVNLAEGQDVTCKFANREEGTSGPEGSLTIIKHTVPAGGTGFAFDAGALGTFSLDDGGSKTFTDLVAGAYSVEETPAADWEFASIECDALDYTVAGASVTVNLAEGEAAVCTFNNGELPYTGSSAWMPLLLGGLAVLLMGLGAWTFSWVKQADKA